MEIIPAILPKNFNEVVEKVNLIVGLVKRVQVDICDGKFVPSTTWPYWKADIKPDENFEAIIKEERGMPEWERLNYEFDLMIENPTVDDMRKWLSAGAERIVLHLESSKDLNPLLEVLNGLVEIGIGIDQKTDVKELAPYIDKIQYVQCMGIRKIGFQGQQFEEATLNKVQEVKNFYPNIKVQVDGGVSLDNAQDLKEAGVDRLVVGSAIFQSTVYNQDDIDNIVDSIREFEMI